MGTRMDKYESDTPELSSRCKRFASLYDESKSLEYDKFDVDNNVSVLKNNARNINVDQIRAMLDKKYRDKVPQRKSIAIDNDLINDNKPVACEDDNKDYDLNVILEKAKRNKEINYERERFNSVNTNMDIVNRIDEKYPNKESEAEEELMELINTITHLELQNQKQNAELLDLEETNTNCEANLITELPKEGKDDDTGSFYTGEVSLKDKDFSDFDDIQDDIKSNSIIIKILVFIFIIIILAAGVYFLNKYLNLGLF